MEKAGPERRKMDSYLEEIKNGIDHIEIEANGKMIPYENGIQEILSLLFMAKKDKRRVFICGNGGSAGVAIHMTADFLKNGGLNMQNLYNQATLTCICNDLNYEYVFSKQLELMAQKDDILIVISSSGESKNIIRAITYMKELGGIVITLTGFSKQNTVRQMGDYNIYVPSDCYGIVESLHNIILQQLVDLIVERDGVALHMDLEE